MRIPGFDLPQRSDKVSSQGGGVAVYAREGLKYSLIDCPSSPNFQCVVNFASSRRSSITVITTYRPPNSDSTQFVSYLESVLSHLPRTSARNICLVGDFNSKHNSWLSTQQTDAAGSKLFSFAVSNGLTQVVPGSTYTTVSGKEVLLDLMFVNQLLLVQPCSTLAPVADHCPTLLRLSSVVGLHRV